MQIFCLIDLEEDILAICFTFLCRNSFAIFNQEIGGMFRNIAADVTVVTVAQNRFFGKRLGWCCSIHDLVPSSTSMFPKIIP